MDKQYRHIDQMALLVNYLIWVCTVYCGHASLCLIHHTYILVYYNMHFLEQYILSMKYWLSINQILTQNE